MTDSQLTDSELTPRSQRKREAITSLFELVDTLPAKQKELVLLKFQQDFSYQEISDALSVPLNTMKVYLHRARKMLREALKEQVNDHR